MKTIIKIVIGIFILSMAVWGYHDAVCYMYELTFISNSTCGIVILSDGIIELAAKKKLPALFYQIVMLCTNVVFFSCVFTLFGWHGFNFSGAFFFLHAIDPPLILATYLLCVQLDIKDRADYIKRVFISPLMIMGYLLFDYIRYLVTGELVYGLIPADSLNAVTVPLIGVGFYLLMAFMSYGLMELKLFVQKKMQGQKSETV